MDTIRSLPAAGVRSVGDQDSAFACLQPDHDQTLKATGFAGTKHIANPENDPKFKFKKSYQRQPGIRFIHPGLVPEGGPEDPARAPAHGLVSDKGTRAGDCFYQVPESELQEFLLEQKESIYRSRRREPLGAGFVRGFQFPNHTQNDEFRFGMTSASSENAKNLIYEAHPRSPIGKPGDGRMETGSGSARPTVKECSREELNRITKRVQRDYNWDKAKIDPEKHRFGKPSPLIDYTGKNVAEALKQVELEETAIVNKHLAETKKYLQDPLGRAKASRGVVAEREREMKENPVMPKQSYGRQSEYNNWGARDCIRGNYAPEAQMPDKDLGVSIRRFDKREAVPEAHRTRTFGLPSIRTDRHAPKQKSIANDMNYGDESDGKGVLYPGPFAYEGVNEEDFLLERSEDEVRDVFRAIGQEFSDDEFTLLVSLARQLYGLLSVDSFRHAINRRKLEMKRTGRQ